MWPTDVKLVSKLTMDFLNFSFIHKIQRDKPSNLQDAYSGFLFYLFLNIGTSCFIYSIPLFAHILDDRSFESVILWCTQNCR